MTALKYVFTAVASLVLVAGIVVVNRAAPTEAELSENVTISGDAGKPVDAGDFVLTVHGVKVAKRIAEPKEDFVDQKTMTTDGLFVVADVTVTMTKEAGPPQDAALVNGDLRYGDTRRALTWDILLETTGMEPAIPLRGPIVFEIPDDPDVLAGASLHLALDPSSRLAGEASVDLGIDGAAAERLRDKASAQVELGKVRYG